MTSNQPHPPPDTPHLTPPTSHPTLYLLLYLLLTLATGFINPLFEAPDEHWHYFTAQYIAETGQLPFVGDEPDEWLMQEAAQPPLYYLIGSLLIRPIDTSQARDLAWPNPYVQLGDASSPTNTNAFIHGDWEAWPYTGYALSAHILRVFSTFLGLGTLIFLYKSARLMWPEHPGRATLALALTAFLPQFIFLHSAISNDTLIIFLSTLAIYQLIYLWQNPHTFPRLLLLGLTIGLAILSKTAGLLLLIFAIATLTLTTLQNPKSKIQNLLPLTLVPLTALLLSGWLLIRNYTLYGDPTAANQFIAIAGGDRNFTLLEILAELPGLWTSLFAVFGWFNLRAPTWLYWLWNAITLTSLLGYLKSHTLHLAPDTSHLARRTLSFLIHPSSFLILWLLLVLAGLIQFMLRTPAAQGRLLFPAITTLALGLAYGLSHLPRLAKLAIPLALLTSLYSIAIVIPAGYAQPTSISQRPTASGQPLSFPLSDGATLIGVDIETSTARPGDYIHLTLYWQASDPLPSYLTQDDVPPFVIEIFGRQPLENDRPVPIGKLQSYQGSGLYPIPLWQPGQIFADPIAVRLDEDFLAPTEVTLFINQADSPQTAQPLGTVKIIPHEWPNLPETPPLATFNDAFQLISAEVDRTNARPGDTLTIHTTWHVIAPPGRDTTTLIHLTTDPSQPPLANGDSPPLGGHYPTHLWAIGELIHDTYTLIVPTDIPAGTYSLLIGHYDPQTGQRLPLTPSTPSQTHTITQITISE